MKPTVPNPAASSEPSPAAPATKSPSHLYVARQPIFDKREKVEAYELLFRSGPQNFFAGVDPDHASRRVIGDSFHVFGLNKLVQDKKLFINTTRNILVEGFLNLLPPRVTVVEVLETVEPDAEVLAACAKLKKAGYTLALDDFVFKPGMERLVELADIIKVDFLLTQGDERRALVRQFRRRGLRFLAEKVESHEDYLTGLEQGYELFQGYFFCRPEMVTAKDVPAVKLVTLRLLRALSRPRLDFNEIEGILKQDVSLPVKLLRYLNSAAFFWRDRVTSIKQAMILLGEEPFRRWASLVTLTNLGQDRPPELVVASLVRARMAELIGQKLQWGEKRFDLFLTGLLSAIDAMVGRPMEEMLDELSLSPVVRQTLLGQPTDFSPVLRAVLSFERGDFAQAALALPSLDQRGELASLYTEAITWTAEVTKR